MVMVMVIAKAGGMVQFAVPRNTDQLANNNFHQRGREAMPRAKGRAPQVGEAFHVLYLLNVLPDAYG